MIKILLAEDHNIVRNGIKILLDSDPQMTVIGEATNGSEVMKRINTDEHIDILVTDINMPEIDGISLIKLVKDKRSETKIVVLSMHDDEKYLMDAFEAGADGYLLKSISSEELVYSIKYIYSGGKYICSEMAMNMMQTLTFYRKSHSLVTNLQIDLSERETAVLHLVADGLTNTEMADKLFVSKRTVEGYRQSLLTKTGSKNTAALIRFAVLNGMIH